MNAPPAGDVLLDTSILLRRTDAASSHHADTVSAIAQLAVQRNRLVIARQNCIEFRGVASRPVAVNRLGMTPTQADMELDILEDLFMVLPERAQAHVYKKWRELCRAAGVSGKQVHDARLTAVCIIAGVSTILTWNRSDFIRYVPFASELVVLTPAEVLTAS